MLRTKQYSFSTDRARTCSAFKRRHLPLHATPAMIRVLLAILITFLSLSIAKANIVEKWVQRYNGRAGRMLADTAGNVYVTGESIGSGTGKDYATIKYDTNGNQLWVQRYNGTANGNDSAYGITLDTAGNVYVTGESVGSIGYDYVTIKYDTNGNELWTRRYNGTGNGNDSAYAIGVDTAGNVYVTGTSLGQTYYDSVTIKYDTNGNQLWVQRYNGTASGEDVTHAIAVDTAGNVYVAGYSSGSGTGNDYIAVKYDTNGNQVWVQRFNGTANGNDSASSIGVDATGNVYVTGSAMDLAAFYPYTTIKYDTNGNQVWVQRYSGPVIGYNWAQAMAVDATGNVYVTGRSPGIGYNVDYATIKYDTNGNQLWAQRYNGAGSAGDDFDFAFAIKVDTMGNVYVAGESMGSGTGKDYATIKYDANGNQLWVQRYNGTANDNDSAYGIGVDNTGNVYVAGVSWNGSDWDYTTIKYGDANRRPIANAGPNQSVSILHDGNPNTDTADFILDASGSTDPDNDTLTYTWYEGFTPIGFGETLPLARQAGNHIFTLVVSDGKGETATDEVEVFVAEEPNQNPTADAGSDQTLEATGPNTLISLHGTASDPDMGDLITYLWQEGSTTLGSTTDLNVSLPVGTHTLTFTATDAYGASTSDTVVVTITDTTAPSMSGVPTNIVVVASSVNGAVVTYTPPTATDLVDGNVVVSCSPEPGTLFAPGTTTVTCTAQDHAGNIRVKTFQVQVIFGWFDILPPINSDGSSVFKRGSTIPVKFKLAGASANITNLQAKLYISQTNSVDPVAANEAVSTSAADTGNTFRYDPTAGQYIFNLSTKDLTQGTWYLRIDLGDGVSHIVRIQLKK